MTCAVVTTSDITNGKTGRSYWFPDTASSELGAIAGGTYSIWSETSHLIDSKLGGMSRWQVINISATRFQAAKFQPKGPVITENTTDQSIYDFWKTQKDYRFVGGDEVDVYRFFETPDGNTVWEVNPSRTLEHATGLAAIAAAATAALLANMF